MIKPIIAAYSSASPTIISIDRNYDLNMLAFLNTKVCAWMLAISNSTLHTLVGNVLYFCFAHCHTLLLGVG